MKYFRSIGALFLCAAALSAAEKPMPSAPRTALVVAGASVEPGQRFAPESLERALGSALSAHVAGYLGWRGERVDLFTSADIADPTEAVAKAVTGSYTRALYVRFDGREEEEPAVFTDSHRRRYYTIARGCLDLTLTIVRLQPRGTEWRAVDSVTVNEQSRTVRFTDGAAGCESYETVLQRAIERALGPAKAVSIAPSTDTDSLPTVVYLPRDLLTAGTVTPEAATSIVQAASTSLARQFNTRLQITDVESLPTGLGLGGDIEAGQRRLRRYLRSHSDTLIVAVNRQLMQNEHDPDQARDELGLSHLGRRQVLINLLPRSGPADTVWYTLANALTVLHEIGHTLGAIHVSDMNSVMAHYATWIGSDRFDPLNRQIIEAALDGRLGFDDPSEYLAFVSGVLTSTPYNLADYPAFFHDYLDYRGNRKLSNTLRLAIGRQSYLWAADGYGLLKAGRKSEAARLFRKALRVDPHQASLYYYLSEATDGAESARSRRTAARMGYLMAEGASDDDGSTEVDFGGQ